MTAPSMLSAANEPTTGAQRPIRVLIIGERRDPPLEIFVRGFTRIAIASLRAREVAGDPMDLPLAS